MLCHSIPPHFTQAADENNEKSKALIKSKVVQYLSRAEVLKTHLSASERKTRSASQGGGTAEDTGAVAEDAEDCTTGDAAVSSPVEPSGNSCVIQ